MPLCSSDIELTDVEILEVEEKLIDDMSRKFMWVMDALTSMPNDIGTRWHNAVKSREGEAILEAIDQAIIAQAKETGHYQKYIDYKKREIVEEHEESLNRRAVNE